MTEKIMHALAGFVIAVISSLGYPGIVLLMAIESACIPLPSEIIMPFSGYLVYKGVLALWAVALAGAVGCVLGSFVAYEIGARGGRRMVERYGRYVLVSHHDLEMADRWFDRYGDITIFAARLLPVIRTFIAFPAGVSRMRLWRFYLYTFVGSYLWCWGLAWIGLKLGENWKTLGPWFHRFDAVIGVALIAGAVWYVRRHLDLRRRS
jgi:membrane protein DedA with SNARE-associated domain